MQRLGVVAGVGERRSRRVRIAVEQAAAVERLIEPLVRIERKRVGPLQCRRTFRARRWRPARRKRHRHETMPRQSSAISASSARGSMLPVATVPAEPTMAIGVIPARVSACNRLPQQISANAELVVAGNQAAGGRAQCRAAQPLSESTCGLARRHRRVPGRAPSRSRADALRAPWPAPSGSPTIRHR